MPSRRILAKSISLLLLGIAWPILLAQVNTGELRLKVIDPGGLGLSASINIFSNSSQYRNSLRTSKGGEVDIKTLPYGVYLLRAERLGFTATTETVEVRSALPSEHTIKLTIAPVNTSVQVSSSAPLIDPSSIIRHADRPGADSGSDGISAREVSAGLGRYATRLAL